MKKKLKPNNLKLKSNLKLRKRLTIMAITSAVFLCPSLAFAAEGSVGLDPLVAISNLTKFVINIVSAVGVIALVWGAVQMALALKSGDQSQKSQAMLYLAGGAIMVGVQFVVQAIGVKV